MSRILIAGAGISGLSLAAALAGSGHRIDVVERANALQPIGAGIVLHPNGMAALKQLGLAETVRALGSEIHTLTITRDDSGVSIPLGEVWPDAEFPTVALRRSDLQRVLAARAFDGSESVRLHLGQEVTGVEAEGRVTFIDGDEDAYDLVAGADGVHSIVRAALFPDLCALELDIRYLRFCASEVSMPDDGTWRTFTQPNSSSGFIPLGSGRFHCFVQRISTDGRPISAQVDFEPAMADAFAHREGAAHEGPAWIVAKQRWRQGQCALLGDAAHALSPTFTEGGSLAIEDAVVLAHCLTQTPIVSEALARYASLRAPRVSWAGRMAASQLLGLRRKTAGRPLDVRLATEYMRQMYRPLMRDLYSA